MLMIKRIKFDFDWGSAQTLLGELTALPQTLALARFKGIYLWREEIWKNKENDKRKKRKRKRRKQWRSQGRKRTQLPILHTRQTHVWTENDTWSVGRCPQFAFLATPLVGIKRVRTERGRKGRKKWERGKEGRPSWGSCLLALKGMDAPGVPSNQHRGCI